MMLQRAVVLGVLAITGTSLAQLQVADLGQTKGAIIEQQPENPRLQPRKLFPKPTADKVKATPGANGKLVVKFADNTKTRISGGRVESTAARDINNAQRIFQQYGLIVVPAIRLDPAELRTLETRAASYSGNAQPDLAGMLEVSAPGNDMRLLEQAARELNDLPEIEFVSFQINNKPAYLGGAPGACCINVTNCQQIGAVDCLLAGGVFLGVGTNCGDPGVCSIGSTSGRCCIPANGVVTCLDNITEANCTIQGGAFGGLGSTCAGLPGGCPPLGACCLPSDQCLAVIESQCVAGNFRGVGSNCLAPGTCEFTGELGRCCIPNDGLVNCIDGVDQESCDDFGGVYGGDGSDCNDISSICPDIGACCIDNNECQALTEAQCNAIPDTFFLGVGENCAAEDACDAPDCGVGGTGPCLSCHEPKDWPFSGGLFCNDEDCCELVCDIDPFCCDEDALPFPPGRAGPPHWDENCVFIAFQECNIGGAADGNVCLVGESGPCDATHLEPGCDTFRCCSSVCSFEPFCCETAWDQLCVDLAADICIIKAPAQATPSLTDAQGYLTGISYDLQFGGVPIHAVNNGFEASTVQLCDATQTLLGYDGSGWDLHGLWQFGTFLAQQLGPGTVNRARGKGIKIGVIDDSAFVSWQNSSLTHEDLRGKVIPEPGQTVIINPLNPLGTLGGHHGTACLGIIGAKDDGTKGHAINTLGFSDGNGVMQTGDEVGIVGIAPEADLYYFPSVSLEQGGRLTTAIAKALLAFGPGDVLAIPMGPDEPHNYPLPANGTLASDPNNQIMFALARDLGVMCCIPAGNNCLNVDTAAQAGGDSGVVIVGAVTPGTPFCRWVTGFSGSNYCEACAGANRVHVSAWGSNVATLGYGNMYRGTDPANASGYWVRSYTNNFGGTSAATAQIAALLGCMQGIAKQMYGIPLTPDLMRELVMLNGFTQCSVPFAELRGPAGDPCVGDFSPEDPPARVFGLVEGIAYPDPVLLAEAVISTDLGGNDSNVTDVCVIRGNFVSGNVNSIRVLDNNPITIGSQATLRGDHPTAASCPQFASQIGAGNYLAAGQVIDILVAATNPLEGANIVNVSTGISYPGVNSFQMVELWDWAANRWAIVGGVFMDGATNICGNSGTGVTQCFTFNSDRPGSFIRASDNRILCRVYVTGLGGVAMGGLNGAGTFAGRVDLVEIETAIGAGTFNPSGTGFGP